MKLYASYDAHTEDGTPIQCGVLVHDEKGRIIVLDNMHEDGTVTSKHITYHDDPNEGDSQEYKEVIKTPILASGNESNEVYRITVSQKTSKCYPNGSLKQKWFKNTVTEDGVVVATTEGYLEYDEEGIITKEIRKQKDRNEKQPREEEYQILNKIPKPHQNSIKVEYSCKINGNDYGNNPCVSRIFNMESGNCVYFEHIPIQQGYEVREEKIGETFKPVTEIKYLMAKAVSNMAYEYDDLGRLITCTKWTPKGKTITQTSYIGDTTIEEEYIETITYDSIEPSEYDKVIKTITYDYGEEDEEFTKFKNDNKEILPDIAIAKADHTTILFMRNEETIKTVQFTTQFQWEIKES